MDQNQIIKTTDELFPKQVKTTQELFGEEEKQTLTTEALFAPEMAEAKQRATKRKEIIQRSAKHLEEQPGVIEEFAKETFQKNILPPLEAVSETATGIAGTIAGTGRGWLERIKGKSPEEAEQLASETAQSLVTPVSTEKGREIATALQAPFEQALTPLVEQVASDIHQVSRGRIAKEDARLGVNTLLILAPMVKGITKTVPKTMKAFRALSKKAGATPEQLAALEKLPGDLAVEKIIASEQRMPPTKTTSVLKDGAIKQERIFAPPDEVPPEQIIADSAKMSQSAPEAPMMELHAGLDLRAALDSMGVPDVAGKFNYLKRQFHSPDVVLGKSPAGKKMWDYTNKADLAKLEWMSREWDVFKEASRNIKEGSPLDTGVFKVRDSQLDLASALKMDEATAAQYNITPQELSAIKSSPIIARQWHKFLGERFDSYLRKWGESVVGKQRESQLWQRANAKIHPTEKWISALGENDRAVYDMYSRKISDYIPHIFDRSEIMAYIEKELAIVNKKISNARPDSPQFNKLDGQRRQLIASRDTIGSGNQILYETLPNKVRFRFFEKRKGMPGYNISSVKAYRAYLAGIARKIFDEPAVKQSILEYNNLPSELRPYAKWYLREFMGYNATPLDSVWGTIKSFMWIKTLGFNPRSAIVNLTQKINTFADAGPTNSMAGYVYGLTDEGRQLFKSTGLAKTTPQVLMEGTVPHNSLEGIRAIAGYLFSKAEEGNLRHAFATGYQRALRKGKPQEVAVKEGIAMANKNQFRYGRVGMPKALRKGPGVAFQFWSYPIKELEFLTKIAKENPMKLIGWLAMAEGTRTALDEFLGIDLSNALGIGINFGEAIEALRSIKDKDLVKLKYHLKQVPKSGGGIFPYGFGPAIETAENIGRSISEEVDGFDILLQEMEPVESTRLRQAFQALKEGKEGAYPIHSPTTGKLLYEENLKDIVARTFFARPSIESRTQEKATRKRLSDKLYSKLQQKISNLITEGKLDQAIELSTKYRIPISDQSIEAAIKRRMLTTEERLLLEESKTRMPFKQYLEK